MNRQRTVPCLPNSTAHYFAMALKDMCETYQGLTSEERSIWLRLRVITSLLDILGLMNSAKDFAGFVTDNKVNLITFTGIAQDILGFAINEYLIYRLHKWYKQEERAINNFSNFTSSIIV